MIYCANAVLITITVWLGLVAADGIRGSYRRLPPLYKDALVDLRVSAGVIRGYHASLADDGEDPERTAAYVFKRIPYAEPPLGAGRFRPLAPMRPWDGVLNATEYGPACMSNTSRSTNPPDHMDEDCIQVNVYSGAACFERRVAPCPVLFYVHAGGLMSNSPILLDDREVVRKYAAHDFIVVTPAYRIGIFGFIDDDEGGPNNLGLNDVVFALNWTAKEIGRFGGDPDRVTVIGYSAGGSMGGILMAAVGSPPPRSLFRSVIVGSPSYRYVKHANRPKTDAIMRLLNCYDGPNGERLSRAVQVECLRTVDAHTLINAQYVADDELQYPYFDFEPSAMLPAPTYAQLLADRLKGIRLLVTATINEFSLKMGNFEKRCGDLTNLFGYTAPETLYSCVRHYEQNNTVYGLDADVIHANTFQQSLWNTVKGGVSYKGIFKLENHTKHGSDLLFMVGIHRPINGTFTPAERLMDEYYPRMIRDFIRDGVPDKDWQPVDRKGGGHFAIDFKVADDGTVTTSPTFHAGVENPSGIKFWLSEQRDVERLANKRRAAAAVAAAGAATLFALDVGYADGETLLTNGNGRPFGSASVVAATAGGALLIVAVALAYAARRWCDHVRQTPARPTGSRPNYYNSI